VKTLTIRNIPNEETAFPPERSESEDHAMNAVAESPTTAPAAARRAAPSQWELPKIRPMGLKGDPFADDDWRLETNMGDMK
jgi:hypothetical protein